MAERRLKAITLDLWDTLLQEVPRKNPGLADLRLSEMRSLLSSRGYDYDMTRMRHAYSLSGEYLDKAWSEMRDIPTEEHMRFMLDSLDPLLTGRLRRDEYAELEKCYSDTLLKRPPQLMEGVMQTLEALSSKGYALGLISNTGRTPGSTLRIVLDKFGIGHFFAGMVFSNELLVRKPDKEIFMAALRQLKCEPSEALHVGNDLEGDFEGAKDAGMGAILLDRGAERERGPEVIHSITELAYLL